MAGLSNVSDAELDAMIAAASQRSARTAPRPDLSKLSDAELDAAIQRAQGSRENDKAGLLDNVVRSIARGATFGFADELAAAGNSTAKAIGSSFGLSPGDGMNWSQRYQQNLAQERGRDDAFDASNPVISTAGQLGGGVAGTFALPAAAARVGGARALEALTPLMTPFKGGGVVSRVGNAAVTGGGIGALTGFGEGRGDVGSQLESTAKGGAIGTLVGGAMEPALALANGLKNWGSRVLGREAPEESAQRLMLRSLSRDNVPLDELQGRVNLAQNPQMLPDLAGRNTLGLAGVAARTPSEAAETATAAVESRRAGIPDRIANAVDTAFGGGAGDDVARVVANLQDTRAKAAAPLYEQAFEHPVTMADARKVQRYVGHDIGQEALQRGMRIVDLEYLIQGKLFDPEKFGVTRSADTGRWIVDPEILKGNKAPAFRLLDAVKRGYDGIVESQRDPVTGKLHLDEWHRTVNDARADYRNKLAEMNPTYAKALEAWSGPSGSMDAVSRGRAAFSSDRDITAQASGRIAEGDRPFFELGAGRAVADMTSDPARALGRARTLIEDRQMQARLATALPEDQRRDFLIRALRREVDMGKSNRLLDPFAGSPTHPLGEMAKDLASDPADGLMARMLLAGHSGGPTGMVARLATDISRRGQGINSDVADVLARHLYNPSQDAMTSTINGLRQRQVMDALAQEKAAMLRQKLVTGAGSGASLLAN